MSSEADDTLFTSLGLEKRRAVIAAVSGGGDSLAMLLLLHAYLERRGLTTRLVAVTVDHGLRPESAAEARHVAAFCEGRGIAHVTKRWTGDKPATGIAEAARHARYRLLAEAAGEAGTDMVVTGHTRDDQAETYAMRSARGEGFGLSGMDWATLYDRRVWIVRPLLTRGRGDLRAWLKDRGIAWIDDPSNENLDSERVRVRRALAGAPGQVESAARSAEAMREERRNVSAFVLAILLKSAMTAPGLVRVPLSELRRFDPPIGRYVLRILVATLGGRSYLPGEAGMPVLISGYGPSPDRTTVSRCVVDRRLHAVYVHRELRGLPAPCIVRGETVWDGRFRIRPGDAPCHVACVGQERAAALAKAGDHAPRGLAVAALAAEPRVTADAEGLHFFSAGPGAPSIERIVAPWSLFLPQSDIRAHNGVAGLIGARTVPAGPWAGHIDAEA